MSRTLILIPSRLSAVRLPNKPLLKINGLSLINHVYKKAQATNIGDTYVVTGDKKIFEDVIKNGGNAILSYKNHFTGTDRIYEGLINLNNLNYDYILNLQGDEPLLDIDDIKNLNKKALSLNFKIGTLACKINCDKSYYDKNIVKVETNDQISINKFSLAINFFRRKKIIKRSKIYQHIGIYIYKKKILEKIVSLNRTKNERALNLEQLRALDNNIPINVLLAKKKPIGVDTKEDFNKVKNILETNNF